MYQTVKGIYENGVLTLLEPAPIHEKSEVMVTFISIEKSKTLKPGVPGGLKHLGGSIPDDFNDSMEDEFDL